MPVGWLCAKSRHWVLTRKRTFRNAAAGSRSPSEAIFRRREIVGRNVSLELQLGRAKARLEGVLKLRAGVDLFQGDLA